MPWWLPSLPSLESPGREAAMWGFLIVILPTEAIAVSPGVTPVASRFNLPMEVVTVSIYGLSPPTWSEGVGETSLSPSLVVGMIWFSAMAGLAAWGFIRSLRAPLSISVAGTITSFLGRTSVATGRLVSADEVAGSARTVLSVPGLLWVGVPHLQYWQWGVGQWHLLVRPWCFGFWPQGWHPPDHIEHLTY